MRRRGLRAGGLAAELAQGLSAGAPIALGYFPVAVTFGILARKTGLSALEATVMSAWVYAGASQFVALRLLEGGVRALEIILATLIINSRHLFMSASLVQRLRVPAAAAAVLAYGVTDETFVAASLSRRLTPAGFAVMIGMAYLAWVSGTTTGHLLSRVFPDVLVRAMGVGLYALFIALLAPAFRRGPTPPLVAALGAGLAWLAGRLLPGLSGGWTIVLAAAAAAAAGLLLPEPRPEGRPPPGGQE